MLFWKLISNDSNLPDGELLLLAKTSYFYGATVYQVKPLTADADCYLRRLDAIAYVKYEPFTETYIVVPQMGREKNVEAYVLGYDNLPISDGLLAEYAESNLGVANDS